MDINFKSNAEGISAELESYTAVKLGRLRRMLDKIQSVTVNFTSGNSRRKESSFKVDLHLVAPGHELHAAAESNSFRAALDTAVESLRTQLNKRVDKRTTKQRSDASNAKAERNASPRVRTSTPWDNSEHRYAVEKYALKPLSAQEALAELKLSKADVLVFVNQSGVVNAAVRRGTRYTIYEPETSS